MARLDVGSLKVQSFSTTDPATVDPVTGCCTGCVSGCGINPTAGGCESQGNTWEYPNCGDTIAA